MVLHENSNIELKTVCFITLKLHYYFIPHSFASEMRVTKYGSGFFRLRHLVILRFHGGRFIVAPRLHSLLQKLSRVAAHKGRGQAGEGFTSSLLLWPISEAVQS